MAAPLRVIDLAPMSGFTEEERQAIKAEAKRLIAENRKIPKGNIPPVATPEDPIAKWKREAEERKAVEVAALASLRGHEARQQRQLRMQSYIERRIAESNATLIEAFGEILGEMQARIEKLEKKK